MNKILRIATILALSTAVVPSSTPVQAGEGTQSSGNRFAESELYILEGTVLYQPSEPGAPPPGSPASPIPGVWVSVTADDGSGDWYAVTDGLGSFSLGGLKAGGYLVRVGAIVLSVTLPPDVRVNIILNETHGSISGWVTNMGNPVTSGFVCVSDMNTSQPSGCTGVRSDGTYIVHGLVSGSYRVHIEPPLGYAKHVYAGYMTSTFDWSRAAPVEVNAPFDTSSIKFDLEPGGSISGTVKDENGALVSNANVAATLYKSGRGWNGGWSAKSNANGIFRIAGLISGSYHVHAQAGTRLGYFLNEESQYTVAVAAPVETPNIKLTIRPAGALTGFVYRPDGAPFVGVNVCAIGYESAFAFGSGCIQTGADGGYELNDLPQGNYRVTATATDYGTLHYPDTFDSSQDESVQVLSPAGTPLIDFHFPSGGSISGRVTRQFDGQPAGGSVCVNEYNTGTIYGCVPIQSDGGYSIGGIPTGDYRVHVEPLSGRARQVYFNSFDWSRARPVHVEEPYETQHIDFALEGGGATSGQVVDEAGNPIANATVVAELIDYVHNTGGSWTAITGPDGSFDIGGLITGTYQVRASAFKYGTQFTTTTVMPGWPPMPVTLTLPPAAYLSGAVRDAATGKPIANLGFGAIAVDNNFSNGFQFLACTDRYGRYQISDIPLDTEFYLFAGGSLCYSQIGTAYPRTYLEEATAESHPTKLIATGTGNLGTYDFQLSTGSFVEGWVYDGFGSLSPQEYWVEVLDPTDATAPPHGVAQAQNGHYQIPVHPGQHKVRLCGQTCGEWFADIYYAGASSFTDAATITVPQIGEPPTIDFHLQLRYPAVERLVFNNSFVLLSDPVVRQAIAYGIDRERILREAWLPTGIYGTPVISYVPNGHWAQATTSQLMPHVYPYDPVEAQRLLSEAGWQDTNGDGYREGCDPAMPPMPGCPLIRLYFDFKTADNPARAIQAEILKENMRDIGIDLRVELVPADQFYASNGTISRRDFNIAAYSWLLCESPDTDYACMPSHYMSGEANRFGYNSQEFNTTYLKAFSATSREDRFPYIIELQKILMRDLPEFPIFTLQRVVSVGLPAGEQVTSRPLPQVTITLSEVARAGAVTVLRVPPAPTDFPADFKLVGDYFEVTTTTVFDQALICFDYDDTGLAAAEEDLVRLYHFEDDDWADVTDADFPDVTANRICGTVTRLSPFAIVREAVNQPPAVETGDPSSVNEGGSITISASGTDPEGGLLTYSWDLDNDGIFETPGQLVIFSAVNLDGPSQYPIAVQVTDEGGLSAVGQVVVNVLNVAPSVDNVSVSPSPSLQGNFVDVSAAFADPNPNDTPFTCTVNYGDGSGDLMGTVNGGTCTGPAHVYINIGAYTILVKVTDKDGDIGTRSVPHTANYNFIGFFQPVDNLPTLNTVKAGSAVPIHFSLAGYKGMDIFNSDYPTSSWVTCGATAEDALEEIATPGSSGLSYDTTTDRYTYVWKTDKSWTGTCRTLVVRLTDGVYHRANFKFK